MAALISPCSGMRKRSIIIASTLGIVAMLAVGCWSYLRWRFPYGSSHCCILNVAFGLEAYAEEHGGQYPTGESSPEASLSLLHRSGHVDPYTLRGMTVPEKTTRSVLEAGGLLSPASCGWHYEDRLTLADDRRIALLWCKEALGHNGERAADGGRQVVFIGGDVQWVSGAKWEAFLGDQKHLIEERDPRAIAGTPLVTGFVELPDGTRLDHVDGTCTVREETKGLDSSSSGTSSGGLGRSELVWYQAPVDEGYVTRTLSFSNLISDPITITFRNGVPDVTNFVFKMRTAR
jgi:hypothetical protein